MCNSNGCPACSRPPFPATDTYRAKWPLVLPESAHGAFPIMSCHLTPQAISTHFHKTTASFCQQQSCQNTSLHTLPLPRIYTSAFRPSASPPHLERACNVVFGVVQEVEPERHHTPPQVQAPAHLLSVCGTTMRGLVVCTNGQTRQHVRLHVIYIPMRIARG